MACQYVMGDKDDMPGMIQFQRYITTALTAKIPIMIIGNIKQNLVLQKCRFGVSIFDIFFSYYFL